MSMRHFMDLLEAPDVGRKRRTTDADFIQMARALGPKSAKMSITDMMSLADANGVQIPTTIKFNKDLKVDSHHWNLSGATEDEQQVDQKVASDLGVPVEHSNAGEEVPPEYANAIRLSKAKEMSRLATTGKVYIFGRKAKGAFFRIKGFEEYSAQLERMLSRELEASGDSTMEEQYSLLEEKVQLIAGARSTFIKSLLITGMPSSGKTRTVMETIKAMGLREGADYIIKKGYTTPVSLFRTFIEQLNGLTIFDDCDSVGETSRGINMLKGALDTEAVREVSNDVKGTINTASLPAEDRDEYAERLSRAMRYLQTSEDGEYFKAFLKRLGLLTKALHGLKKTSADDESSEDDIPDDDFPEEDSPEIDLVLSYVRTHLPNKIDFKGRIIFISNKEEDEWDAAILSRGFYQNLSFSSVEMLNFIDRIKDKIITPGLDEAQKTEVWDYIRDLYTTGKLKRAVNFRLAQQAFDLRFTSQWKKMLAQL